MRDRERVTSRDREEGFGESYVFDGATVHDRDRDGRLGRMEQSIDQALGNDWEKSDRVSHARPSFWERVKAFFHGGHGRTRTA